MNEAIAPRKAAIPDSFQLKLANNTAIYLQNSNTNFIILFLFYYLTILTLLI